MKWRFVLPIVLGVAALAYGKVDLVTLPSRDAVQLTIYNSADLTLARERRALTLKEGANALQFSWADTLIDPTSLEMLPKAHAAEIDIAELVFPPSLENPGPSSTDTERGVQLPIVQRLFKNASREGRGAGSFVGRSSPSCLGLWNIESQVSGEVPVEGRINMRSATG